MKIVEALYAARRYTPADMLDSALTTGSNPHQARLGSIIVVDYNGSVGHVAWEGPCAARTLA